MGWNQLILEIVAVIFSIFSLVINLFLLWRFSQLISLLEDSAFVEDTIQKDHEQEVIIDLNKRLEFLQRAQFSYNDKRKKE